MNRQETSDKTFADENDEANIFFNDLIARVSSLARGCDAQQTPSQHTSQHNEKRVGDWRLMRCLGRGGMGAVFLGQHINPRYPRKVAIKFLPCSAGDPVSQARFVTEQKILAQLDHPHIAQFIDSGFSEDNSPYFVMRYVEGLTIDHYIRTKKLDLNSRLHLFLQICDAVQYAHKKCIVHRDLKPANVLVTDTAKAVLLDFGIAKILSKDINELEITRFTHCPLTPAYAAPELIDGAEASVASDIFGLGTILFELLAGCSWHQGHESRTLPASFPPPKPSAATCDSDIAKRLRGDLDTIVTTALQEAPEKRYPSADALAADVKAVLSNRPICARPQSTYYLAYKFWQRHRLSCTASIFGIFALCIISIFSVWQMRLAQTQRDFATHQQNQVQAGFDFYQMMFQEVGASGRPLHFRELLDKGSTMLAKHYQSRPASIAPITFSLAQSYNVIGERPRAIEMLSDSADLAASAENWDLWVRVQCQLADLQFLSTPDLAHRHFRLAQKQREKNDHSSIQTVATCALSEARYHELEGNMQQSLSSLNNALALLKRAQSESPSMQQLYLNNRRMLLHYSMHNWQAALDSNLEQIRHFEALGRASTIDAFRVKLNRAKLLDTMGDILGAAELRQTLLDHFDVKVNGGHPPAEMISRNADSLFRLGKLQEPLAIYQGNVSAAIEQGHVRLEGHHYLQIGNILSRLNKHIEATTYFDLAEVTFRKSAQLNLLLLNRVKLARAKSLRRLQQYDRAESALTALLDELGYPKAKPSFLLSKTLAEISRVTLLKHDFPTAHRYAQEYEKTASAITHKPAKSADLGHANLLRSLSEMMLAPGKSGSYESEGLSRLRLGAGKSHPAIVQWQKVFERLENAVTPPPIQDEDIPDI